MKSCEKCGTHKEVTKHHIIPRIFGKGKGGICYLCRTHHDEIEQRILKVEHQMSGLPCGRFKLEEQEYRDILNDYLSETIPFKQIVFGNLIRFRKYKR